MLELQIELQIPTSNFPLQEGQPADARNSEAAERGEEISDANVKSYKETPQMDLGDNETQATAGLSILRHTDVVAEPCVQPAGDATQIYCNFSGI